MIDTTFSKKFIGLFKLLAKHEHLAFFIIIVSLDESFFTNVQKKILNANVK